MRRTPLSPALDETIRLGARIEFGADEFLLMFTGKLVMRLGGFAWLPVGITADGDLEVLAYDL